MELRVVIGSKLKEIFPKLNLKNVNFKELRKYRYLSVDTRPNYIFDVQESIQLIRNKKVQSVYIDLNDGFRSFTVKKFFAVRGSLIEGLNSVEIRGNILVEPLVTRLWDLAQNTESLDLAINILQKIYDNHVDLVKFLRFNKFNSEYLENQKKISERLRQEEIDQKVKEFTRNLILKKLKLN